MRIKKTVNINLNKKRKGVALIVLVFSGLAILMMAALVIDLGMIFNTRYEFQKLIDTTALTTISNYDAYETTGYQIRYPTVAEISTNTNSVVNNNINAFIKSNSFLNITKNITPTVTFGSNQSRYSRAIRIDASAETKTYLLSIIGIRTIRLNASAAAINIPVYLSNGSILNGNGAYSDTDIREPVGGPATSVMIHGTSNILPTITNINKNFSNIYGSPDGTALSLGPGGYITIKFPQVLADGRGFDFQILTRGQANGYFVFVGNDTNPSNPYINAANPGGGISWVNVSCTGTPIGTTVNQRVGSYNQWIDFNSNGVVDAGETQPKFYGSGYFDLGAVCTNNASTVIYNRNVKTAKYLKIIDDNVEDGFILRDPEHDANLTGIPSFFPGQHSSFTPGVSIDAIGIEHHPRLISLSDFTKDTDNDGLLDVFENALGLGPCGPSDGTQNCGAPPTSDDAIEFWGFNSTGLNGILQDTPTSALRYNYPTRLDNPPRMYVTY